MLQHLIDQKSNLRKMFICDECNSSQWRCKQEGKDIYGKVYETTFWNKVEEIILINEPLVKVCQMLDGDKPAMVYIYGTMD
jgi:hypothetical protein